MPQIFGYLDYRKFLSDYYDEKKRLNYRFSHRHLGKKGGFDPGLLSKVLTGGRDISRDMIQKFIVAFELKGKAARYFRDLVHFTQATAHDDKKKFLEKLMAFSESDIKKLATYQYEYFEKWYYSAVRELLNYYSFTGDFSELGRMLSPPITSKEARGAIGLLEKLGMIIESPDGSYRLSDAFVSSGFDSHSTAVNNYVIEGLSRAKESLNIFKHSERNLSSLVVSMDKKSYNQLVEKIRKFRKEVLSFVEKSKKQDSVYQLNMQFFPVTRTKPIVPRKKKGK